MFHSNSNKNILYQPVGFQSKRDYSFFRKTDGFKMENVKPIIITLILVVQACAKTHSFLNRNTYF